jgi:hypothetical protein
MQTRTNPLDRVKVAAPCPAEWERMTGDDRQRFCHQCSLNVYNLSGMTRREAEALVADSEGRLCVRYFRRADGTILTSNCPVGLRALKRRASRVARACLSAVLTFLAGVGLHVGLRREPEVMGAMEFEVTQGMMLAPVLSAPEMPFNGPVGVEEGEEIIPVAGELTPESREEFRQSIRQHRTDRKTRR